MSNAYIEAIASYLPDTVVSNADLGRQHPEWRMDDVAKKTGVLNRHWCRPDETALDLAATAVERVFTAAHVGPQEVDSILFCTQTPDFVMPPNACLLQDRLGFPRSTAALDFTHACSGYLYGLYLAKALIESRSAERVLLVTAETYSKRLSPDDRGPATLFGDAAAATLIRSGADGIGEVALGTDGNEYRAFFVPSGGARNATVINAASVDQDRHVNQRSACDLYMDGPAVLSFVSRVIPAHVNRSLEQWDLTMNDIDLVVFHQASKVSLDMLTRALRLSPDRTFSNIEHVGNTVSASIPLALSAAEQVRRLKDGMRILLVGFGVGMSWGSCVITWKNWR